MYRLAAIALVVTLSGIAAAQSDAWSRDNEAAQQALAAGRIKDAEKSFSAAVKDAQAARDDTHLSPTLVNLAAVYVQEKRFDEADQTYNQALKAAERKGAEDPMVLIPLDGLTRLYVKMSKFDKALQAGGRALTLRDKLLGADAPEVAANALTLGNINYGIATSRDIASGSMVQGTDRGKIHFIGGGKSISSDAPDFAKMDHAEFDNLEQDFAAKDIDTSRLNKALGYYKQAAAIYDKLLGPESGQSLLVQEYLGRTYLAAKKYGEAEGVYKNALAVLEKENGPDSLQVCPILVDMEELATARGAYGDAEALIKRELAIREKAYGADSVQLVPTLRGYSFLLTKMKRKDEAKEVRKRADAIEAAAKKRS